jgi:hypothetical protein
MAFEEDFDDFEDDPAAGTPNLWVGLSLVETLDCIEPAGVWSLLSSDEEDEELPRNLPPPVRLEGFLLVVVDDVSEESEDEGVVVVVPLVFPRDLPRNLRRFPGFVFASV